ncbi:glutaredoxin domain-containing protein [Candidatus Chlorohelix sp.]|uniref:glutaredoxin family protein n=1 Tax=Candidatus Chlorohelix sp. TaxID=3139201 RepID=UPI00304F7B85
MANNSENNQIVMYGTTMCSDCRRAKQFFEANKVSYKWVDLANDPDAVEFVLAHNNGMQSVPTIIFPDGSIMVEPSNKELAEKLAVLV